MQNKIQAKFCNSSDFLPYIEEIRFPAYKTLEHNLKISFEWPITALVGPNGTNKSSILQAISAAPEGRSLAPFWFSTEVDDIDAGFQKGTLHRFIYKYRFDKPGTLAECRKSRVSKLYRKSEVPAELRGKKDPDYWEPTKRVDYDKMDLIPSKGFDNLLSNTRDRWTPINKQVVYIDFRSELSSFDKYIHHESFDRWTPNNTSKRHRAVVRSKHVAKALKGEKLPKAQRSKLINPARELPNKDIETIARILGKPIGKVSIVEHKFFGPIGYTVKLFLQNSSTSYSEAHAGSGEYAVVRLVDQIRRADSRSLILLDEPEVSLHPGAQVELLKFLEAEVLANGHQIVFSTHSPFLIEGLPHEAIKVLGFNTSRERVVLVADGCSPTEAFTHLGHTLGHSDKPRIIVEDDLVVEMIKASLRRHAPTKLDTLQFIPFPGGANGIVQNLLSSMAVSGVERAGILLDGDQLPPTADSNRDVLAEAEQAYQAGELKTLQALWREQFHETQLNLFSDSDGARDCEVHHKCILWAHKHLDFLPGKQPEQALAIASDPNLQNQSDWKGYWLRRTVEENHLTEDESKNISASDILECQKKALNSLHPKNDLFVQIAQKIESIIEW